MLIFIFATMFICATSSHQMGVNNAEIKCLKQHTVKYCDARR